MSERIKQLAEQARHWAHFDGLQQNPTSTPDILFEGKFAELIVKECIGVSYLQPNSTKSEEWQKGYAKGQMDARMLIKQHFGVTE